MTETTIQEHTTEADRARGFRAVVLTDESPDSRQILAINIHHSDNLALEGDAPAYHTIAGCTANNVLLAALLTRAAAACLAHPHQSVVGFEITRSPRALCHEG